MAIGTPVVVGSDAFFSSSSTVVCTVDTAVSVGDDIFVFISCETSGTTISSVADTGGNTYTVDASANTVRNACFFVAHARCATALSVSDTITATYSAARSERLISACKVSGIASSTPLDKTATGNGTATAWDSGNTATTTQADELVIGGATDNAVGTETDTAGTNLTELFDFANSDGVNQFVVYRIVAATGAYKANGTSTNSGGRVWNAAVATYKGATGGTDVTITHVIGNAILGAASPTLAEAFVPSVGALTLSASAPTIAEAFAPTVGTVTLGGVAPTFAESMAPLYGLLTLAGTAPTIEGASAAADAFVAPGFIALRRRGVL